MNFFLRVLLILGAGTLVGCSPIVITQELPKSLVAQEYTLSSGKSANRRAVAANRTVQQSAKEVRRHLDNIREILGEGQ